MSRLEEMISRLIPGGVEFKALGDTGTFIRGNGLQKKHFTESGVGCIHYGQIHTHYGVWATETIAFVSPLLAKRLRRARTGDLVIATTSEDDEAVGKAVAWLGAQDIAVSSDAYIYRHSLDPRYVAYFFQSEQFRAQKNRHITGTKVRRLSGEGLSKVRIPVPPVEIQREIVKVLDSYTQLQAELEVELEAEIEERQRQYLHYHHALLSFPESGRRTTSATDIRWVALGDIAKVRVGQAPVDGLFVKVGEYSYVNAGRSASGKASQPNTAGGTITIPSRGQGGVGIVGYQAHPFWCGPLCYRIECEEESVNTKYLYYFLKSIQDRIRGLQNIGGTPALNRKELVLVSVAVPSAEEQARIVAVLEKLDALVKDLTVVLPAEVRARCQQFQYYRDRMLTFREAELGCTTHSADRQS